MVKLENPSENWKNIPHDEYSESSSYIQYEPKGSGFNSDRNHYYAKTNTSSDWYEVGQPLQLARAPSQGRNSFKPKAVRLEEKTLFWAEESSILPTKDNPLLNDDNDINITGRFFWVYTSLESVQISQNKTVDNLRVPALDFGKYLTKTEEKRDITPNLAPDLKLAKITKNFKDKKYSEIQTVTIDWTNYLKPKGVEKHVHCRSATDLRPQSGCSSLLWDWSYTSRGLKRIKANLKDFRAIQMENTSLTQKLNQERENVIAEQKKYKALEKEKQRLEFEVKKLSHHNHELQKSININNNYEDIQHVINELSGMMLSSNKNPNITEKQRKMIKVIFGDVATQAYKDKIQLMEENLDSKTREWIDLREELRNLMANYLDDIHKLDQPRVPISLIQEKLIKNNVDFDPEILREWVYEYEDYHSDHFYNRKTEILNRVSELNCEASTKPDTESSNFIKRYKTKLNDIDTFMLELDHLEKYSTKQLKERTVTRVSRPNTSRPDTSDRDLMPQVSNKFLDFIT